MNPSPHAVATVAPHASALPQAAVPPQVQTLPNAVPYVPQTIVAQHFPWLTHGVAGIFMISALSLIVLLAVQTTKQEGLSGTIGGRVESAYRGRVGAEEQIKRLTGTAAVVFVLCAFVLSLTGI